MKYLVIKGWLGFGDRLESLKMGIKYALDNDLAVYVDWTDTMWSHSGESFYTYFKLINIKTFSLSEIPSDATYYPEYWKTHIHDPIHPEIIKDRSLDLGVLNKQYPADVIVLSNVGRRLFYPDSTFFSNVFRVIDSRVLDKIKDRLARIPFFL